MIHFSLNRTTDPASAVVSTAEFKAHARVDVSDDDTYIDTLVAAATRRFEQETNRALVTQTWAMTLDHFPYSERPIRLPRAPLQSVSSITYVDNNGDTQTWDSSKYSVDSNSLPARIYLAHGEAYPTTRDIENAVTVTFVAGFGDASTDVPPDIVHAIKLLAGHWYEHRESVLVGTVVTNMPQSWSYLANAWKVWL